MTKTYSLRIFFDIIDNIVNLFIVVIKILLHFFSHNCSFSAGRRKYVKSTALCVSVVVVCPVDTVLETDIHPNPTLSINYCILVWVLLAMILRQKIMIPLNNLVLWFGLRRILIHLHPLANNSLLAMQLNVAPVVIAATTARSHRCPAAA